jgi:hypothetical protein
MRMSGRLSSRAALAALPVALIVLGGYLVLQLLSAILNAAVFSTQTTGLYDLAFPFAVYVQGIVLGVLPFVIGVFLSLWLVLPISAKQSLVRVIGASLLAVVIGTVLVFVVALAGSLFGGFDESAGRVYGWVSGLLSSASVNAGRAVVQTLYSAASLAISLVPLTVLGGVLSWNIARGNKDSTSEP